MNLCYKVYRFVNYISVSAIGLLARQSFPGCDRGEAGSSCTGSKNTAVGGLAVVRMCYWQKPTEQEQKLKTVMLITATMEYWVQLVKSAPYAFVL